MTEAFDVVATQQRGGRVAGRAEISDIRLLSSNIEVVKLPGRDVQLSYSLDSSATVEYDEGDSSFVVRFAYTLEIEELLPKSDSNSTSATVANIQFDFGALFSLDIREGEEPPSGDELQAYALTTGQFALYPYAREYVYDITGRLALPPLTLGVMRLP